MNKILCISAVLYVLLNVCSSFGQTLYPMTPNASVTITSCEGLFMDDGASTSNYGANQTSIVTICSSNAGASPIITFNLALFDIHTSDVLNVYDGPSTASPLMGAYDNAATVQTIQGNNVCLTFEFISDGANEGTGFEALMDCYVPCQDIISVIGLANPTIINPGNEIHLCQGDSLHLLGSGVYPQNNTNYTQSDAINTFEWDIDDDGLIDVTGLNIDTVLPNSQGYRMNLIITDTNNCVSQNFLDLRAMVSTDPSFFGISFDDTICFLETNTLSLDSAVSNSWQEAYGNAVADTVELPDGAGVSFSSTVSLSNFSPGQTLTNINDLTEICLNIEHSYMGDLQIEITCPTGQSVILLEYPNGGNGTFLGEPVDNDAFQAPPNGPYIQGLGYDYCFSSAPTYGTMDAEASVFPANYTYNYTDNAGVAVVNQAYLPSGSYASQNPLTALLGCELNGNWSINITDNLGVDNGAIFSWYVDFNPAIFPNQLWGFDPGVTSSNWITDADVLVDYGDSILVSPSANGGDVSYAYTLTDDFGCSYDTVITFYVKPSTDPSCRICFPPDVYAVSNLCNGDSTGSLVIIASDSLDASPAPYTITWMDISLNNIMTNVTDSIDTLYNMPAGTYFVQIEDANNCIPAPINIQIDLTQPDPINTFMIGNADVFCAGQCTGFAEIDNFGGISPYTYLWPDYSTLTSSTGLCAGTNTITITDANACINSLVVTISEPPAITVTLTGNDTICQTEIGYLTAHPIGGNAGYTYLWSSGSSNDTIYFSPTSETEYTLIVTDGLGCVKSISDSVYVRDFLSVVMIEKDTICNGDSIYVEALTTGGDGNYFYQWTNGLSASSILGAAPIDNATFFLTLTDGCATPTVIDRIDVITGQYPIFVLFPPSISEGCAPLNVEFSVDSIKSARNYIWSFGDASGAIVNNSNLVGHFYPDPGCYDLSLNVTTNLGCSRDTIIYCAVEVYPNPISNFVLTDYKLDNITSTATMIDQSYIPEFWQWNFGDGENSNEQNIQHTYKDTGYFTVTLAVETANGCKDTSDITIHIDYETVIYTPNSFSPNADGLNDIFLPKGEGINPDRYLLTIYNRWGNVIYTSSDVSEGWDGKLINGALSENGGYVYRIDYLRFGELEQSQVTGPLTLIR